MTRPHGDGTRRTTIGDVASAAGVSASTVSRAIQGDPQISARTRERVLGLARQLGYVPNEAARSLVLQQTAIVALVIPDMADPLHGQVASGFEQVITDHARKVIVACSGHDPARERDAIESVVAHRVAGIAVLGSVIRHGEHVVVAGSTPCVFINPENVAYARDPGTHPPGTICSDDASGMAQLVDHLVERGYRRIAYVPGPDLASNIGRRDPLAAAVRAAGLDDLIVVDSSDDWRDPVRSARSVRRAAPDAVVCYDDKLAIGLISALRADGVDIPGELAVTGFDGIPFAGLLQPSLTTVAQPSSELGRRAASSLLAAIDGVDGAPAEVLAVELVVGESTPPRG